MSSLRTRHLTAVDLQSVCIFPSRFEKRKKNNDLKKKKNWKRSEKKKVASTGQSLYRPLSIDCVYVVALLQHI